MFNYPATDRLVKKTFSANHRMMNFCVRFASRKQISPSGTLAQSVAPYKVVDVCPYLSDESAS